MGMNGTTPFTFFGMINRVKHQTLKQVAAELPPGWVFGVQLGLRQTRELIKTKTLRRRIVPPAILLFSCKLILKSNVAGGTFRLLNVFVLISACVCRRPSWTPKTQPGGSSAASWLSFWCSTRLDIPEKKWPGWRGKLSNRVKHQKLNQVVAELPSGWVTQPCSSRAATWLSFWCSTRPSADTGTD